MYTSSTHVLDIREKKTQSINPSFILNIPLVILLIRIQNAGFNFNNVNI